jgi:hypothetical protein
VNILNSEYDKIYQTGENFFRVYRKDGKGALFNHSGNQLTEFEFYEFKENGNDNVTITEFLRFEGHCEDRIKYYREGIIDLKGNWVRNFTENSRLDKEICLKVQR